MNDTDANPYIAALQVITEKRKHLDSRQPDDDEQTERPDQHTPQAKPKGGRWKEKKWIPGKNGKLYGPYWYERWRQGGKCRSKYLGKVK